jgi:pentatricopeptide repeat protein
MKRRNLKLYNRHINEAAKRKSLSMAKALFSQLQSQSLEPDEFTYTCMINASSRCHSVDESEHYLAEMRQKGLKPNEITFTALIKGASSVFDLPRAHRLLKDMVDSGVSPNARTFNTMLRACFRTGDFSLSKQLTESMKKYGVKPDTSTLQSLTQIQAQAMQLAEANDSITHLEAMIQQKEKENDGNSTYFIDPSVYLLLASVAIVSGTPLKRAKLFMTKFDEAINKLKSKASNKSEDPNNASNPPAAAPIDALDPEMLLENKYIRSFLEKGEGFSKIVADLAKQGPRASPFVKTFISGSSRSEDVQWSVDAAVEARKLKRKLEICSGSGDWIVEKVKDEEQRGDLSSWAALEIRFDRVHEMWRKVLLNGLEKKITIIHADATHVKDVIPESSVDEVFINFPDPPHSRWSAQRMITSSFLRDLSTIIVPGGMVVIATDDFDYIRWIHDDSKALFRYFDTSRTTVSKSLDTAYYGSSFFDALWASRGRTERGWLTLYTLTEDQRSQAERARMDDQL